MARILHLIPQLEEGGAQRYLSYVVSLPQKHEVEVASLIASPSEKLFPFFRNPKVPIHYLSYTNDFYSHEILPSIRKLLKNGKYDLVVCWMFESIVHGVIACVLDNVPCIAYPHNMREKLRINQHKVWERYLIGKTMGMADLVLFPSYSTAIDSLDAGWVEVERVRVAHYGIDCEYFFPVRPGDAVVTVGRLSSEKGYTDLERIVRRLREYFPTLRCLLAGSGTGQTPAGVECVGFLEDIREVFQQAAIYLNTSWIEGMSVALMEAQAMGIPAVARRIGPNSEVIDHGYNGFLAVTEDDFVDGCRLLLQNPSLRTVMGETARAKALAQYSLTQEFKKLESIYDELL